MKFSFRKLTPYFVLGIITVCVFYKFIFLGQTYFDNFDNFNYIAPAKFLFAHEILQGHFPFWNPYIFTGIPYLADIALGPLNFLNVIYLFLPSIQGVLTVMVIDVLAIAIFQYLLLKHLKISTIGSLIGALVFAFAGVPFIHTGDITFLGGIPYIPIIFLITHKLLEKKTYKYLFLLILLQTLQIFAGHPRTPYYTVILMSFFILCSSAFSIKRKVFILVIYYVGTTLLSMVQLLPFIEFALHSNRPVSNILYASSGSLDVPHLITFILPTFFGTHAEGTWWGPGTMIFGYMGIPAYIFLGFGLWRTKIQRKLFYFTTLITTFLLAFGLATPVYTIFYYLIPGWSLFRGPITILVFFTFFATIFIGFGFDYFIRYSQQISKRFKWTLWTIMTFFIPTLALFMYGSGQKNFWNNLLHQLNGNVQLHLIQRLLIYDSTKLQTVFQGILENVVILLFLTCITGVLLAIFAKKKKLLGYSFVALVALVFIYYDNKLLLSIPISKLQVNSPVPSILNDAQSGEYRILSLPVELPQKKESLAEKDYFYKEQIAKLQIYTPNNNIESFVYNVKGTSPLIPDSFARFIAGSNSQNTVTAIDFSQVTQDQLNLASVKYILSQKPIDPPPFGLKLVLDQPGAYAIYENPLARKRLYTLDDPLGSNVQILSMDSQKIVAKVRAQTPTSLIITNWYYPGWEATVNGKQVRVYPYKGTFQSIYISKGEFVINFTYRISTFCFGLIITSIAFIIIIFLYTLLSFKKFN